MGDISIKGRSKLLGGGRAGFKSGGRVGLKDGGRTGKQFGGPLARPGVAPTRPLAQPGVMPARPLGFKSGGRTGFKSGTSGLASEKMKSEVAEVAKKKAEVAKKKRDTLQAQHKLPGGGGRELPGPHKIDYNRRDLEPLLRWLPKKTKEKTLAFANKMDKKMETHYKKKRTKEKMQKRAKKLTAYEGIT